MLAKSGWVRRGRALRTPSDPKGSSGKEAALGAAGAPTRIFVLKRIYSFFNIYGKINS